MKRLFVDTNILLDILMRRDSFLQDSAKVVDMGMRNQVQLVSTALTFSTCVYVSRKHLGYDVAIENMKMLEKYFEIAPMADSQLHAALYSNMPDFEDMLQYRSAVDAGCDVVVTRNVQHFPQHPIPAMTPTVFLSIQ